MPRARKQPNGQLTDYKPQPVTAAPGQTYGEAGKQRAAQKVIPLPDNRTPMDFAVASAQNHDPFSGVIGLDQPTQRPNEPITTGLGVGAGAGPEILGMTTSPVSDTLSQLAGRLNDPALAAMAAQARAQGV